MDGNWLFQKCILLNGHKLGWVLNDENTCKYGGQSYVCFEVMTTKY